MRIAEKRSTTWLQAICWNNWHNCKVPQFSSCRYFKIKTESHTTYELFLCRKWAFSVSQQMNTMPIAVCCCQLFCMSSNSTISRFYHFLCDTLAVKTICHKLFPILEMSPWELTLSKALNTKMEPTLMEKLLEQQMFTKNYLIVRTYYIQLLWPLGHSYFVNNSVSRWDVPNLVSWR